MPKRGSDADSRIFFDELVSLTASRLRASGAIRLEDRHGLVTFGEQTKAHRRRPYKVPERRLVELLSFAQNAVEEPRSFGSSTMHHAAGSASKSSACAIARLPASAGLSV